MVQLKRMLTCGQVEGAGRVCLRVSESVPQLRPCDPGKQKKTVFVGPASRLARRYCAKLRVLRSRLISKRLLLSGLASSQKPLAFAYSLSNLRVNAGAFDGRREWLSKTAYEAPLP